MQQLVLLLILVALATSCRNEELWMGRQFENDRVQVYLTDEGLPQVLVGSLVGLTDHGAHPPAADLPRGTRTEHDTFEAGPEHLRDCQPSEPDRCVRVVDHLELQETEDGGETWSTVFRIDPEADEADADWVNDHYFYVTRDPGFRQVMIDRDGTIAALIAHDTWLLRSPEGRWTRDEASFRPISPSLVATLLGGLGVSLMAASAMRSRRLREMIGNRRWPLIGLGVFVTAGLLGTPGRVVATVPLLMGGLLGLIGIGQGVSRHRILTVATASAPTMVATLALRSWHLTGDPDRSSIVLLYTLALVASSIVATAVDSEDRFGRALPFPEHPIPPGDSAAPGATAPVADSSPAP